MRFLFDRFELDTRLGALLVGECELPLEPRAFALLCLLVENHDRLVTKDEIIEKVWDSRIVTDAALSTGIKSVRKALGDDGQSQRFVRTIRGRGFRFGPGVRIAPERQTEPRIPSNSNPAISESPAPGADVGPSIAILPFHIVGFTETFAAIGDAIPTEILSSLSRLRWLRVIARGSSFRFRNRDVDIDAVRMALGAGYVVTGIIEIFGSKLAIVVDLIDAGSHEVVWSERYPCNVAEVHEVRSRVVNELISALELHIPLNEARKARLHAPESLDAWSAYHLGLQHMYRFNRTDNDMAAAYFERATDADPQFSRAFAARSFTSFQRAFLKYSDEPARDRDDARRFAERSMEIDPLDPFGNFNLARTHWLDGDPERGLSMLERAVLINPNFAQGHYARAWTDVMAGRGEQALTSVDQAITLSPLDPFLYAMQATRGFAHIIEGRYAVAAEWAERGARAPGAHFLIGAIAVAAHHLNGDAEKAGFWADNVRRRRPDASSEHFFRAFPFSDDATRRLLEKALQAEGL